MKREQKMDIADDNSVYLVICSADNPYMYEDVPRGHPKVIPKLQLY